MNRNSYQQNLSCSINNKFQHFLKRTLQFVISVSLVSLFLCISPGFSLFPNSFIVYFNTCLFSFLTHTLERKYMFLICNGILAFLAKKSISSFDSCSLAVLDLDQEEQVPVHNIELSEKHGGTSVEGLEQVENIRGGEFRESIGEGNEVEEEDDHGGFLLKREQEEDDDDDYDDEEEELEEESKGDIVKEQELASTEELNRKFEEFIRKMKEEIRIEARKQVIVV